MYDSIVWSIFNRIIDSNVIVLLRIISGYSVLLIIGEGDCFAMDGVNISNCVFDMLGKGCLLEIQQSLTLVTLKVTTMASSVYT